MKKAENYQVAKNACYIAGVSMSVVATLSPLLFVTFREMYGISYTLLGLLAVVNYFTQLLIDLAFTFFTKFFPIHKSVRVMSLLNFLGMLIYGTLPLLFPNAAYIWILLGTVVFSVAAGLCEVLASPVIAAIPSDNPEREMSKLHSMYAWGVVLVVVVSTVFLKIFGNHCWNYLALLWALVPLVSYLLFQRAELPPVAVSQEPGKKSNGMGRGIILCTACIFFGGAAECNMTQWASGFLENAMGIPKLWGDILGVAVFAVLLGLGRTGYAKYGKNILSVMLWGMIGATVCYMVASLSLNPVVGLAACVLTGLFTAMLWPGTLICIGENFPGVGVAVYALMAAGGDMGASLAPQLVGILSDKVALSDFAHGLSSVLGIGTEQIGMRSGLLVSAVFPLLGIVTLLLLKRYIKQNQMKKE